MSISREKAIVLLSGGLDSTVALAMAHPQYEIALTLTLHYGQKAWSQELKASEAISNHYRIPHRVIHLPWLAELLPEAMQAHQTGFWRESSPPISAEEATPQVWIPNRNGLFLNLAASFAEAYGASVVVFGANAEEGETFPDNTPAFRDCLNQALSFSTLQGVRVETPVGHLRKVEILHQARTLEVPLSLIWSCYEGGAQHCGVCPSCQLLKQAMDLTSLPHPVSFQ